MHTRTLAYSVLQLVLSNPDGGDKCPALERLSSPQEKTLFTKQSRLIAIWKEASFVLSVGDGL